MSLARDLAAALGADAVVTDPDVLDSYRHDHALLAPSARPAVAVRPASTAEVAEVVRIAAAHDVPIVTRGAGTGLAGGANAVEGCIVLSTGRLDRIVELDVQDRVARVQPGVLNAALEAAAAAVGLWYPPDPASRDISTIGGNVATNAGGLCCVKYGVTRESVLGLEVVLADGTVTRLGRRTVKGVAGYDLVGLFVGSEGTLGIVTEVTVRLRPARPAPRTLVATFDELAAAGEAIAAITRTEVPALLELLDRTTIAAVERRRRMGLADVGALLVAQSDLPGSQADDELARLTEHCETAGASDVAWSSDPADAELLLAARRDAYPALEAMGRTLLDDVCVPTGRIATFVAEVERIAAASGLTIGTFGHAGDGNMHPTIVFSPGQEAAAHEAFDAILSVGLELGGTITGEHGVGSLKRTWLGRELDDGARALHHRIRAALDPDGRFNPGAVLGTPPADPTG
jgi:glycolate oxidase